MIEPPDERSRPAANGPANESPNNTVAKYARPASGAPYHCPHGRTRFCTQCLGRRRMLAKLLDDAIARLDGPPSDPMPPSDFGLTPEQMRAEASRLFQAGWSVDEITAVLAVPAPAAAV